MTTASNESCFIADWPVPPNVRSLITTRHGGVSQGSFSSLNLGDHVGDDPVAVVTNRQRVGAQVNALPLWLEQVHGIDVVDASVLNPSAGLQPPRADASYVRKSGVACAVMTADCLPVLFSDDAGQVVAAAHAGWRGLLAGVLEQTIAAMAVPGQNILAYLGPAIGPQAFEVGDEVRRAFVDSDAKMTDCFKASTPGKWLANLYQLARLRMAVQGVTKVSGGDFCTYGDRERFFSYRRDGQTGRMASMIWLE